MLRNLFIFLKEAFFILNVSCNLLIDCRGNGRLTVSPTKHSCNIYQKLINYSKKKYFIGLCNPIITEHLFEYGFSSARMFV